jgi:hypothetical protein
MILKWFQLPLLLPASLLFLHSTCAVLLVKGLHTSIFKQSRLHSWSYFCLLKFQHSLTYMSSFFNITDYDVRCIVKDGSAVCPCRFHNMVTCPSRLVSTDFGKCSSQCSLSNFTPISLEML